MSIDELCETGAKCCIVLLVSCVLLNFIMSVVFGVCLIFSALI